LASFFHAPFKVKVHTSCACVFHLPLQCGREWPYSWVRWSGTWTTDAGGSGSGVACTLRSSVHLMLGKAPYSTFSVRFPLVVTILLGMKTRLRPKPCPISGSQTHCMVSVCCDIFSADTVQWVRGWPSTEYSCNDSMYHLSNGQMASEVLENTRRK